MYDLNITDDHIRQYAQDGFISFDKFLEPHEIELLRSRVDPLFRGEWQTGLAPDEVNWQEGRDRDGKTRQLCNTWKADYQVASVVLKETVGRVAAQLSGWEGTRIHLDNIIWKPPGASGLTMHQDGSYNHYMVPNRLTSLWMALDDTSAAKGTVLYVKAQTQIVPGRRLSGADARGGADRRRRGPGDRSDRSAGGRAGRALRVALARLRSERRGPAASRNRGALHARYHAVSSDQCRQRVHPVSQA
jgi:hypothetical protein